MNKNKWLPFDTARVPLAAGASILVLTSGCARHCRCQIRSSAGKDATRCTLSPDALQARQHAIGHSLRDVVTGWEELPDGFAFDIRQDDAAARSVLETVLRERRCCGFVRFLLEFHPRKGTARLEMHAGSDGKIHLRELLAPTGLFHTPMRHTD